MPLPAELPNDIESLKRLVLEQFDEAEAVRAALIIEQLKVEKLRFEIARLRRERYGRSSEQMDIKLEQLELTVEDLEASQAALPVNLQPPSTPPREKPVRRPLPKDLPREEIVHAAPCACPSCGGELRRVGEDVAEMLEWVPGRHKVIRHVRPKFSCERCETLVQAPAPARPIARGIAGPGLLAHVLVSKYADHLPLYRQSRIFAREGIDLERSTLADWVGGASDLLSPLVEAIGRYALGAKKLHADDTPVPVLCPGRGTTRQGRLWTYVRDDRGAGSAEAPAVLFRYSPDRKGERPREHLYAFRGYLQADGYAGFDQLYGERIQEVACWAHYPELSVMPIAIAVAASTSADLNVQAPDNTWTIRSMRGRRAGRASVPRGVFARTTDRSGSRTGSRHRASSAGSWRRNDWSSRCSHGQGSRGSR
jgi:transposase